MINSTQKQEIALLTPLRGVAALGVLVFHLVAVLPSLHGFVAPYAWFFSRGYLWVDFFFLLSGFVISHVYAGAFAGGVDWRNFRAFLVSRVARLYPLHLFSFGVLACLAVFFPGPQDWPAFAHNDATATALLSQIFLLQSFDVVHHLTWNLPAWSVGAEFYVYLLFPVLALAMAGIRPLGIAAIIALCLACLHVFAGPQGSLDITYEYGVVRCLLEFVIGMGLYALYSSGRPRRISGSNGVFLAALALPLLALHVTGNDVWPVAGFAALIFVAADNTSAASRLIENRLLRKLGETGGTVVLGLSHATPLVLSVPGADRAHGHRHIRGRSWPGGYFDDLPGLYRFAALFGVPDLPLRRSPRATLPSFMLVADAVV